MRSFLLAISAALTLILSGWVNTHFHAEVRERNVATYEQADQSKNNRKMLQEWNNDMLRTMGEGLSISNLPSNIPTQQNVRQRGSSSTKTTPHVSPCQHMGHVTDIINFSPNVSSQSNEYFLHTLCRLRI